MRPRDLGIQNDPTAGEAAVTVDIVVLVVDSKNYEEN